MSAYNFDEDKLFQEYMEKGIIDSNTENLLPFIDFV